MANNLRLQNQGKLRHELYQKVKAFGLPLTLKWTQPGSTKTYWLNEFIRLENARLTQEDITKRRNVIQTERAKAEMAKKYSEHLFKELTRLHNLRLLSKKRETEIRKARTQQLNQYQSSITKIKTQSDALKNQYENLLRQQALIKSELKRVHNTQGLRFSKTGSIALVKAYIITKNSLGIELRSTQEFKLLKNSILQNGIVSNYLIKSLITTNLEKEYNTQVISIDIIDEVKFIKPMDLGNVPMFATSFQYNFLSKLNGLIRPAIQNETNCVIDFIFNSLVGKRGFINLTIDKLITQFTSLNVDLTKGITTNQIMEWVKTFYSSCLSIYALNPQFKKFQSYTASSSLRSYCLAFIINNAHCYPIYNDDLKRYISTANRINYNSLMPTDLKFAYSATQYQCINANTDIYTQLVKGTDLQGQVYLVDDVLKCAIEVIEQTKAYPANMYQPKGELKAFVHPLSGKIIESGEDYAIRKQVCEKFYGLIQSEDFIFRNQSLGKLGRTYFDLKYGRIGSKSHYNLETLNIIDMYPTGPLVRTIAEDNKYNESCRMYDINNCYAKATINMQDPYPIFSILDTYSKYNDEPITAGEYVLDEFTIPELGGIIFPPMNMSYTLVRFLLESNYITASKILLVHKASYVTSPTDLSDYMKDLEIHFPRSSENKDQDRIAKLMSLSSLGYFGKKYTKHDVGFITDDMNVVAGMLSSYLLKNGSSNESLQNFNVTELKGHYYCRERSTTRLNSDHGPIYRQIICAGIINLLKLVENVYNPNYSRVIGYNTDCVYIDRPNEDYITDLTIYKMPSMPMNWNPKAYYPYKPNSKIIKVSPLMDWKILPDIQFNGDKIVTSFTPTKNDLDIDAQPSSYLDHLKNISFMCTGMPGCFKTYLLTQIYDQKDTIVLNFTNKVCQNIVNRLGPNARIYTLDSEFKEEEDGVKIFKNVKRIICDEFSQIPTKWMRKLIQLKETQNIIIQLFGDPDQCSPIEEQPRYFDYMNRKAIRELVDYNLMIKEYVPNSSRYDQDLYDVLDYFKTHQTLPKSLESKLTFSLQPTNISKINDTRKIVNAKVTDELTKLNKYEINPDGFYIGCKVICNENKKNIHLYNSRFYYIVGFDNGSFILSNTKNGEPIQIDKKPILYNPKWFALAHCITVYRYQGDEISGRCCIHDVESMNFHELYTAMSRCTKLSNISMPYTTKFFNKNKEPLGPTNIKSRKASISHVYEMYNKDHDVYYIDQTNSIVIKNCTSTNIAIQDSKKIERLEPFFKSFKEHQNCPTDPIHNYSGEWVAKLLTTFTFFPKNLDKEKTPKKSKKLSEVTTNYIKTYIESGKKLINAKQLPVNKITYKMNKPTVITPHKCRILCTNGYYRFKYERNGKMVDKMVSIKSNNLESLTKLEAKIPDKNLFLDAIQNTTEIPQTIKDHFKNLRSKLTHKIN